MALIFRSYTPNLRCAPAPLFHDHQAGTGAERPSFRLVHPIDRFLIHEEKRIAISLDARLQAIGSCCRPIAAGRFTAHEKNSLATLGADDKTSLHDIREDQHREGVLRDLACG